MVNVSQKQISFLKKNCEQSFVFLLLLVVEASRKFKFQKVYSVEQMVNETVENVNKGNIELTKALKHKKSCRKKKISSNRINHKT